ncbi:DUF4381 domain-containing protein [Alteromonas lipotrueiana]|uniref:DUF4381 domain-containing protein n=1 Tax=Alteromonas lipotrueiana TaxID=2803815 RepID=UPI001C45EA1C|nr:DUF4381 domain-containing protein [Alteromonas lipotrueiana]
MNEQEQQLLAQLKDIQIPETVSYWPLAWGWWVVIFTVLTAAVILTVWLLRQRRFNAARRQALHELNHIGVEADDWPSQINQLLKRTAISYYPAPKLAGLYGQRWTQFLLKQLKPSHQTQAANDLGHLQSMLYQPAKPQKNQFPQCKKAAEYWLKKADFRRHGYAQQNVTPEASHV